MSRSRQILRVARHELRLSIADRRLVAGVCLLMLVTGAGIVSGTRWVNHQRATISELEKDERSRKETIRQELNATPGQTQVSKAMPIDARSPAIVGGKLGSTYATLQPKRLAVLAIGQSDLLPFHFRVSTESFRTLIDQDEIANPAHLLSGRLDLGFAVIALYPLIILAISFDMPAAEKEAGTFGLLMSQPIRFSDLILGKVLSRFMVMTCCALAISTTVIVFGASDRGDASVWKDWSLWASFLILYGAFWFALAVAANLIGKSSASNALMLSGCWLTFVLIVPAILNLIAVSAFPMPSRITLIQAARQATIDASEEGSRSLSAFYEDHPELAEGSGGDVDEFMVRSLATRSAIDEKVRPLIERFDESLEQRQRFISRARYLSPALLAQDAIESIAGTGTSRHREFLAQTKDFHQKWQNFFVPRIARKAKFETRDLEAMPQFQFEEDRFALTFRHLLGPAIGLIVQFGIVLILIGRSIRDFRVVG